ncbi:hypothetical protein F4803DRAFT_506495 [Xylaria telfairii]|nr:hypothetical protein F4803DRAFT_506495 [Xylaria telfairii]
MRVSGCITTGSFISRLFLSLLGVADAVDSNFLSCFYPLPRFDDLSYSYSVTEQNSSSYVPILTAPCLSRRGEQRIR